MYWNRIKSSFFQKIATFTPRQRLEGGLLLIGTIFLGMFSLLRTYDSWQGSILSFSQLPQSTNEQERDSNKLPQKITIPAHKIDLQIEGMEIVGGNWPVSTSSASYLLQSALPGEIGNVIIYGHNRSHLFGPLRWVQKGEEILLKNKKEEIFVYEVIETKVVSPDQIEVLLPTKEPTLTLYTCFGFLDAKRFVVVGRLKESD